MNTMRTNEQKIDVIIYRVREQGLEVFMVNPSTQNTPESEAWPSASEAITERLCEQAGGIELDPIALSNGAERKAIAVEADWHDMPSLRALMYEDYRVAKEKAKQHLRNLVGETEKGAYVAVKEALKRALPEQQYAFLKELKDIISDKNQTKYV